MIPIEYIPQLDSTNNGLKLFFSTKVLFTVEDSLTPPEKEYFSSWKSAEKFKYIFSPTKNILLVEPVDKQDTDEVSEMYRRHAVKVYHQLKNNAFKTITICTESLTEGELAFIEGFVLAAYQFLKYKSSTDSMSVPSIFLFSKDKSDASKIAELKNVLEAVYKTRDLVNEPVIYLTAEKLSEEIMALGKQHHFSVEVFNKAKIQSLKMGGILAVNSGSMDPPTFNVLEYKSPKAKQSKPIVFVGKGVVFDTGGLSLKPTEHSMDMMKCDMAGAAAVIGLFMAVASNNLPVHIIGLIPATDNRPGEKAITPGDIITMHNGKTVEVLNTDAEGRLILADALSYAQKFNPEIVIDLATLTGSALRAIGKEGIVYMGNGSKEEQEILEQASWKSYERMVRFPFWEDYNEHIQSDIADLKNIGTSEAGAISAGKFLEHFTNYPWFHLDIAGGAFMTSPFHYWPKGGTGLGVRLLYAYLKLKINH